MDDKSVDKVAVNTLWAILYAEANFYQKKTTLILQLYGDVLARTEVKEGELSTFARKKLYENIVVKPFAACAEALLVANKETSNMGILSIEDEPLNTRGDARLQIISNLNSPLTYSPKTNKNIYLAAGNILRNLSFEDTELENKGLFELIAKYITQHQTLSANNQRMVTNSFVNNIENKKIMSKISECFEKALSEYERQCVKELMAQNASALSTAIMPIVRQKIDKIYTKYSLNYNNAISGAIVNEVLERYQAKLANGSEE